MFREVTTKPDFPALERAVLKFWDATQAFETRRALNAGKERWSFIDGPITANNPMGVHHAWGRTYKDLWNRYHAMRGHDTRYQNGFDCQGLWIEVEVEKELGFTSKKDIEAFGIARFVDLCKERVHKFSQRQTEQSIRLGYWMDWDNSYYTMSDENNYSIWMFLKRCHEKGYIYKGHDVMPWCPRCATGISQHEIVTDGYAEITHRTVTLRFPLVDRPGESLLVWTTTPWTLTSNVAAAVHPELPYAKVRQGDEILYLSKGTLHMLKGQHEVIGELPGKDLAGWRYVGPFDELPAAQQQGAAQAHRVILWEAVGEDEGTGIVHIAPGCGAEDYQLSQRDGLPVIAPLDESGTFVAGFGFLTGLNTQEAAEPIFNDLKAKGRLYKTERYTHRYPTCWRCKSELVFRLVDEWFISMDELRHDMMAVTRQIRWIPDFGLERELDWLRNMHDWMISKKRYWGLALPIYECHQCGQFEVIGSETELQARAIAGWDDFAGHSPHRPWIDAVKIRCSHCGAPVSRIADVGNPWLDAGIVPYSTLNYRHDRAYWEKWFPADFITESFPGQFRNWFYSLLAMSTVLENRPPFLNVLGYALVRDEHGEEMHKSKGNAIWFDDAAEQIGVDTMRWMYAAQRPDTNLNFGVGPANETRRRFILPLWNVYSFFVTYARLDGWTPDRDAGEPQLLDRWLLARLQTVIGDVTRALDDYAAHVATQHLEAFVEDLSNWYVRRSRRRFWKSEADADKAAAYHTLYTALTTLCKLLSPFVPFLTETMYQNLVRNVNAAAPISVHHQDWPQAQPLSAEDTALLADMAVVLRTARLGRAARSSANIKLRQPLSHATVVTAQTQERDALARLGHLVIEELNVKRLEQATDESALVDYRILPNNKALGPKFGAKFPAIRHALAALDANETARRVRAGQSVTVSVNGESVTLSPDDVLATAQPKAGLAIASEGPTDGRQGLVVAVDAHVDASLADEGLAREFIRKVQTLRKAAGLELDDRIHLYVQTDPDLAEMFAEQGDLIRRETLAERLTLDTPPDDAARETFPLADTAVAVGLVKH